MTRSAAVVQARARVDLTHSQFDQDTQFVAEVLKWIGSERRAGRLKEGAAVGFVLFDFRRTTAAALGEPVDLRNGAVVPGALHLCNAALSVATRRPQPNSLVALEAHVIALERSQMLTHTSVLFEPASRRVEIRLACLPRIDPIGMVLADGLAAAWSEHGLDALNPALDRFQAMIEAEGEGLLHDGSRLRGEVRTLYRNALFLHLTHHLGLVDEHGFKVVARRNVVSIRDNLRGRAAKVTAIGTRSDRRQLSARWIARMSAGDPEVACHVSCLGCCSVEPRSAECGLPPLSLRHRHVEAA